MVVVSITDDDGGTGTDTRTVHVENAAPTVGAITGLSQAMLVNAPVVASALFTDPGINDTHQAIWYWGDDQTPAATVAE